MQIGFAKVDITPELPCTIIGYGKDGRTATSVLDPIYAKKLWTDSGLRVMTFDLLFVPRIKTDWIVSATHNHSAPMYNTDIKQMIDEAPLELDMGSMFIAQTTCELNINRRRMTWRGVKTKPNPYAFRDNILTFIKLIRGNSLPIYIINYACHATMWHGPSVSADWPGRINLDGEVIFLQGFSGDLIPDNRIGTEFKKSSITEADMDAAGERVARAVREAEHRLRPCRNVFRIFNLVP